MPLLRHAYWGCRRLRLRLHPRLCMYMCMLITVIVTVLGVICCSDKRILARGWLQLQHLKLVLNTLPLLHVLLLLPQHRHGRVQCQIIPPLLDMVLEHRPILLLIPVRAAAATAAVAVSMVAVAMWAVPRVMNHDP